MLEYEIFAKEGIAKHPKVPILKIQPAPHVTQFIAYHDKPKNFIPLGKLICKPVSDFISQSFVERALRESSLSSGTSPNVFIDLVRRENEDNLPRFHLIQGFFAPLLIANHDTHLYEAHICNNVEKPLELTSPFRKGSSYQLSAEDFISMGKPYLVAAKSNNNLFYRLNKQYTRFAKKASLLEQKKNLLKINSVMPLGNFVFGDDKTYYEILLFGNYTGRKN